MTEELDDRSAQTGCGCEPQMPSRRNFIRTVAITAATLVVMPATFASADNVPITWIDLGAQPEPTTTWTKFILPDAYNGETIFIRKVVPQGSDASIYQAISARCTHRHCVVAFDSDAVTFNCPCHGAKFDSNSYPIQGPAKTALPPLLCQWSKEHLIVEAPNPSSTSQTD